MNAITIVVIVNIIIDIHAPNIVATALLDALLAHARQAGLRAVWLGTTEKFLAAHRFYEKSGFTEVPATALPASFPRMKPDVKFYRIAFADRGCTIR